MHIRKTKTMHNGRGNQQEAVYRKTLDDDIANQNKMFRSFTNKENINANKDWPNCTVLNNKFSSVTLHNSNTCTGIERQRRNRAAI